MWPKIINVVLLGIPSIIRAIAEARRKKRAQEARIAAAQKKLDDAKAERDKRKDG